MMSQPSNTNDTADKPASCSASTEQQYICALDSTGRELTKPMNWADAEAWVKSPLTKAKYPEGVVIVPASYPPDLTHCSVCGSPLESHGDCSNKDCETHKSEWSGSPDPRDPDNFWIDDNTGERVNARTGERTLPPTVIRIHLHRGLIAGVDEAAIPEGVVIRILDDDIEGSTDDDDGHGIAPDETDKAFACTHEMIVSEYTRLEGGE